MKVMIIILKYHDQNDNWNIMRCHEKYIPKWGLSKIYPCRTWRFFHPIIPLKRRIIFQISSFFSGATGGSAQRAADRRFSTTTAREESFLTEFLEWEFMGFWRSVVVLLFESDKFLFLFGNCILNFWITQTWYVWIPVFFVFCRPAIRSW